MLIRSVFADPQAGSFTLVAGEKLLQAPYQGRIAEDMPVMMQTFMIGWPKNLSTIN